MQGKNSEVRLGRKGGTALFGSRMARIARKFSKEGLDF